MQATAPKDVGFEEARVLYQPVNDVCKADDDDVGQTNCPFAATSSAWDESPVEVEVHWSPVFIRKEKTGTGLTGPIISADKFAVT